MSRYIEYKINSIVNFDKKHYKVVKKRQTILDCDGCAFYLKKECGKFNCNPVHKDFIKVINIL